MRYWLCIISIFLSLVVNAQNRQESGILAKRLVAAGNYESARQLYERMAFFSNSNKERLHDYRAIAFCHLQLNQIEQTIVSLERAIIICDNKVLRDSLILEKTELLLHEKRFFAAQQELFGIGKLNEHQFRSYQFLLGIALYGTNAFQGSEKAFLALAKNTNDSAKIQSIFMDVYKKLDPRRPTRAKHLSMIIPGSGQFLAGDIRSGINSLLLVGLAGYLYYISVSQYGIINGIVAVLPWFTRYHSGGGLNAERAMTQRQAKHKHNYFEKILTAVQP